ncbi:MAG: hypothetical protein N4A63_09645 [Vallitalea sp.]|jgi:tetratricopeptide (TPR) repeat protein|nr:hypothetical protein [Vallitalea sp.]MCT4597683.1 hypothetical protein [Vallitalea sp.]
MKASIDDVQLDLLNLVNKLIETNNLEEALEKLLEITKEYPSFKSLTCLGYFYMRIGEPFEKRWTYKTDKSINVLEQALTFNPMYHYTYSLLGEGYIRQNMYKKVENILKQGLKINNDYVINNNLGVALFKQGNIVEACKYFCISHNLGKNKMNYSYYPYLNYAICLALKDNIEDSLKIAEELINLESDERSGEVDIIDICKIFYLSKKYYIVERLINEALQFYSLGFDDFIIYSHSLIELNHPDRLRSTIVEICEEREEYIQENLSDTNLSETDKMLNIKSIKDEITKYTNIYNNILNGCIPSLSDEIYVEQNYYEFKWLY